MPESKPMVAADLSALHAEVAQLLVETLNLQMNSADIGPDQPLFGDGLGLDSIDALEIALAVSQRYGFQLRSDDVDNTKIFASLKSLSEHIRANRTR